jgi:putative ABC transport system permease protein
MLAPRWHKVLRDLWLNRVRTILIMLVIAVGTFAAGVLAITASVMRSDLPQQYAAIQPAHLVFNTSLFDEELLGSIKNQAGVTAVEGRRSLSTRLLVDEENQIWRDLFLYTIPEFEAQEVYQILHISGEWPPSKGSLLMERGSLAYLGLTDGAEITLKTPAGKQRSLRISGVAHDLYHIPAFLEGTVYGYIDENTLAWLGEDPGLNEVYVRLDGDLKDKSFLREQTDEITDLLEDAGLLVYTSHAPEAGSYPLDYITDTVVLLLSMLGFLILLLSCFLVINTINALIAQQERQIGVLKAIGGRRGQITGIYLGMIFLLGLGGTLIAIPCSFWGAKALLSFISGLINYDLFLTQIPAVVIVLQVCTGIVLPLLAALLPVWNGARKSPAQALSEYGRNTVWSGMRWVDGLMATLRIQSRPMLLAVRNPFRRRSRLIFSLIMLTLAGGSFITVMNLNRTLQDTVENMLRLWSFDFWIDMNRPYSTERLQQEISVIPGVDKVEGWGFEYTRRTRPDGSKSDNIFLFAAPPETPMTQATLLQGRWLRPDDSNAVVIGAGLLNVEPDLALGGDLVMRINGEEETFKIVGVMEMLGNQSVGYLVYVPYDYYTRVAHKINRADMVVVQTTSQDAETRRLIGAQIEKAMELRGLDMDSVLLMDDEKLEINSAFRIIIVLLMIMVFLLAFVGGLGLMGTISLNVIERSREIGSIRAFGGSNRSVFGIVTLEGVVMGVLSWIFSLVLAIPLTFIFCDLIGNSFLNIPLAFRYSLSGALLWLGLVIVLALFSSALPAWSAVKLTVREILAFE